MYSVLASNTSAFVWMLETEVFVMAEVCTSFRSNFGSMSCFFVSLAQEWLGFNSGSVATTTAWGTSTPVIQL